MRSQPNRDYISNDVVQTPVDIARRVVGHFQPKGSVLEPCRGEGNFYRFLPQGSYWCEIAEGKDFLDWDQHVDWIITNPPWSRIRDFMQQSMKVADNIVFLMTVNHVWTKARIRDIQETGFGIREIALVEMPPEFPQSGFQLGAVYVKRGWSGDIAFTDLSVKLPSKMKQRNVRQTRPAVSPSLAKVGRVAQVTLSKRG